MVPSNVDESKKDKNTNVYTMTAPARRIKSVEV